MQDDVECDFTSNQTWLPSHWAIKLLEIVPHKDPIFHETLGLAYHVGWPQNLILSDYDVLAGFYSGSLSLSDLMI